MSGTVKKARDPVRRDRNRPIFVEECGKGRGFTLVEVLVSVIILGIVGVAATNLVLRLMEPREATVRYEQVSLAARIAAEQIWDTFAQTPPAGKKPPEACLPPSNDPPAPGDFKGLDENFEFAYRCTPFVEDGHVSDTLYQVRVWLRRTSDDEEVGVFDMLALLGGYASDEDD